MLGQYVTPVPAQQRLGPRWYTGSADAIFQSLNLVYDEQPDHIVVFGADHVYRMDPAQMVEQHVDVRRGRDRRRHPGAARPRPPRSACIDTDAVRPDHPVPGEAGRAAARAGRPGRDVRVDGQLRVHAPRRCSTRCARTPPTPTPCTTWAATSSRCWSTQGDADGLRLRRQRRARRDRARPRLLARRRDDRRLLRRAHGPGVGAPGLQPLQPAVADPHRDAAAAAGEVRRLAARAASRSSGPGRSSPGARARLGDLRRT